MKYISIVILFFSFILIGAKSVDIPVKIDEARVINAHSLCHEDTIYAIDYSYPVFYVTEPNTNNFYSSFRSCWQMQETIVERIILEMKRIIVLASMQDTVLLQNRYTLFNNRLLYSKRFCSLYYVYAMRHIII